MFINQTIQNKVNQLISNNSKPLLVINKELYKIDNSFTPIKVRNRTKLENLIRNSFKPQVTITLNTTDTNSPLLNTFKAFLDDRLSEVNNGRYNSLFYFQDTLLLNNKTQINLYIYNCALINFEEVYIINSSSNTTNFEIPFTKIKQSFREAVEISTALLAFYRPQHLIYKNSPSFRVQLNYNNFKFVPFKLLKDNQLEVNSYKYFERVFHYMPKGQYNPNINQWLNEFNSYYDLELKVITNATPEKLQEYSSKVKEIETFRRLSKKNNTL